MGQQEDVLLSPEEHQHDTSYDEKDVIDGITVYKVYNEGGPNLWNCLLQAMGKM